VIAYRHADPRFPFLREDSSQSAGRWNAPGELTHYILRYAGRCLGEVSSRRGNPRSGGSRHRPPRPLGGRHRRSPVAPTEPASGNTDRWAGYLAGMPAGHPSASGTCRRHRRAFGGAESRRGPRMARRRRPPTRPRPGRAGLRAVRPSPGCHRLGSDFRRPSEPEFTLQNPAFPWLKHWSTRWSGFLSLHGVAPFCGHDVPSAGCLPRRVLPQPSISPLSSSFTSSALTNSKGNRYLNDVGREGGAGRLRW